jgi:hypothetical protein
METMLRFMLEFSFHQARLQGVLADFKSRVARSTSGCTFSQNPAQATVGLILPRSFSSILSYPSEVESGEDGLGGHPHMIAAPTVDQVDRTVMLGHV